MFGNIKNPATEAIGRGWIQLAGTIATTIMLWAAVSHYNYRIATGDLDEGDYGFVDLPRPDHCRVRRVPAKQPNTRQRSPNLTKTGSEPCPHSD